ncbi:MAG TPA: hypothetical protein PKV86_10690, partial [Syntrophobacteraceae bacterium]|nr:hypothetical protein [Syntrophobacteraceae bacterium]
VDQNQEIPLITGFAARTVIQSQSPEAQKTNEKAPIVHAEACPEVPKGNRTYDLCRCFSGINPHWSRANGLFI